MPEHDAILMSLVIFVPSVFALVLMILPKLSDEFTRWWSLLGTAVTLVLSICMFISYHQGVLDFNVSDEKQTLLDARVDKANQQAASHKPPDAIDWIARYDWIPRFHIQYFLGVDGISMPLILLTTGLSFLAMLASWNIERYVRGYCILFLLLETGMIGTFMALDFFLFYIFWEVMLLPMYFLIGVWGGPRREYAAIKFFLYTLLGSVFILIALLAFYFTDVRDFVGPDLVRQRATDQAIAAGRPASDWKAFAGEYHTFDLVALAKAGRAASLVIQGQTDRVLDEAAAAAKARAAADAG